MLIKTKYLGEVKINKDEIILFKNGVLGFENSKKFVLLNLPDNPYFRFLQDIENSYISFLVINPWEFFKSYDVELPDNDLLLIGINPNEENNMEIYTIVTLSKNFNDSTSNLLAPIVINQSTKKGKQFILNDSIYTTKHKLFPEGNGE